MIECNREREQERVIDRRREKERERKRERAKERVQILEMAFPFLGNEQRFLLGRFRSI